MILTLAAKVHNELAFVTRRVNCEDSELCKTSKAFTKGVSRYVPVPRLDIIIVLLLS